MNSKVLGSCILPLLLIPLIAGCGGAPPPVDVDLGIDAPESWSSPTGITDDANNTPIWWWGFNDPGLDRVIITAIQRNPDLRAASARLDEALALAKIAGADLYPSLQASIDAGRRKQNFVGLPIPGSDSGVLTSYSTNASASLQLGWEIDLWGRIRSGRSAAAADVQASVADLYGARLSLAGRAAKAWFALIEAQQQTRLAEATVESYRATASQVERRFETGVRTSLDLRLARSNLASAEAALQARKRGLDAATRQLEILLGGYPEGTWPAADELPPLPESVPGGLPAELIARRPDLAAAERRLAGSGARVSQAKAALYPRISLTASGGTSTGDLADLLDSDFSVWSLLGNLTAPLFQGGRLRGQVSAARARENQALEAFVASALRAYAEVEQSLAAEGFLLAEIAGHETAATEAVAAQSVAEEQYRSGLVGFVTVLEAQRAALNAQSRLLAARRLQLENRVDLHLALGGGFDTTLPESFDDPRTSETRHDRGTGR